MGHALSRSIFAPPTAAVNDFELVVRVTKELEHILTAFFGAEARGLHEKISAVEGTLPTPLVRRLRSLATIRNKLIHERGFDALPDRPRFIRDYEAARHELDGLLAYREAKLRRDAGGDHSGEAGGGGGGGICALM